jgi:hypothetical protein
VWSRGHLECSPIGWSTDMTLSHLSIQWRKRRRSLSSSNKTLPIDQQIDRDRRSDTSRASSPTQTSGSSHPRPISRQDTQGSGDGDTDRWQRDHCTLSRGQGETEGGSREEQISRMKKCEVQREEGGRGKRERGGGQKIPSRSYTSNSAARLYHLP